MLDASMSRSVWNVTPAAFPEDGPIGAQAECCLRYAILAPSSHNSQPWTFAVDGPEIVLSVDESRWLAVADEDRRELFLGVGCALENLLIAADHFGLDPIFDYHEDDADDSEDADGPRVATVWLDGDVGDGADPDDHLPAPDDAFEAITDRRTSHEPFEDRPIPPETLEGIEATGDVGGVETHRVEEDDPKRAIGDLQYAADERRMADPEYRRELGRWIGSGALGDSWLKARIGQLAVTHLNLGEREGEKNSTLVSEAPVLELLATPEDDRIARIEAGRAFERMALAAAAEGVAVHPISQILEVPDLKADLADVVGIEDATIQHLFRLGYARSEGGHTPRWPVEEVLESR
jgi:nitroreductase